MPSLSGHLLCAFGAALHPLSHTACNKEGSAHLNIVNCCTGILSVHKYGVPGLIG